MSAVPEPRLIPTSVGGVMRLYSASAGTADVDRFLRFAVERQRAADRRAAGEPQPWSEDLIIQQYKFCMVVRDDDRTSREARAIILGLPQDERLGVALGFRLYNRVSTLVALRDAGVLGSEDSAPILRVLEALALETDVFCRAYKISIGPGRLCSKEDTARALARAALKVRRGDFALRRSGQHTAEAVQGALDICAPFTVGQIVQDLRWIAPGPYDDEAEWCVIGPGAARGLARLCGEYGEESEDGAAKLKELEAKGFRPSKKIEPVPGRMLPEMTALLAAARNCAELSCRDRVTLTGIQHLLCETDKYTRIAANPGERKGRRFVPFGTRPAKRSRRHTAQDACTCATANEAATAAAGGEVPQRLEPPPPPLPPSPSPSPGSPSPAAHESPAPAQGTAGAPTPQSSLVAPVIENDGNF
jgi:hypothetical protein